MVTGKLSRHARWQRDPEDQPEDPEGRSASVRLPEPAAAEAEGALTGSAGPEGPPVPGGRLPGAHGHTARRRRRRALACVPRAPS